MATLALTVALPISHRLSNSSPRLKCASNLRQIALAAIMYAYEEPRGGGIFPRTSYDPATANQPSAYTGINSPNVFAESSAGRPLPNDVTAALFHLLKSTDLTPEALICPQSDAVPLPETFDLSRHSNFPGPEHLSYSYANPYPASSAVQDGWKFDPSLTPDYPFATDMNPGDAPEGGPTKVAYTDPKRTMMWANSPNHFFQGQQVVYADGHVEWQSTPFCGAPVSTTKYRDNIYAANRGTQWPADGKGGVIAGASHMANDYVLLPTAKDTRAGASITLPPRFPGMPMPEESNRMGLIIILAAAAAAVVAVIVMSVRKKPQRRDPVA